MNRFYKYIGTFLALVFSIGLSMSEANAAATVTKITGANILGVGFKCAIYRVAMDNSYPAGGEAIDLTDEFTYLYFVSVGNSDAKADFGYNWGVVAPDYGSAIASTTVLIVAYWIGADTDTDTDAAETLTEVTATTDLSGVGTLKLMACGK